jgi:hypothetical protein
MLKRFWSKCLMGRDAISHQLIMYSLESNPWEKIVIAPESKLVYYCKQRNHTKGVGWLEVSCLPLLTKSLSYFPRSFVLPQPNRRPDFKL